MRKIDSSWKREESWCMEKGVLVFFLCMKVYLENQKNKRKLIYWIVDYAFAFLSFIASSKKRAPPLTFLTRLVPICVSQSYISVSLYWSWQGTAASVVLVCCLTGFNILGLVIVCCACVQGVSLRKKCFRKTYWGIMRQLVGSEWKNSAASPPLPLRAGLCPRWEVRNQARCAKCLWSIITDRVLDLACLPPHLVACCVKHILLYN